MEEIVVPITKNKEIVQPVLTDIRTCWVQVKEGIEEILSANSHLTYMAEDVYSECVNDRAMLFTSPLGFVVLTIEVDPFTDAKTLVVWVGYVYEIGKNNWLDHIDWFDNLAQHLGCRFIEAQSDVPELESYFTSTGWELETKIYTREVPYGE